MLQLADIGIYTQALLSQGGFSLLLVGPQCSIMLIAWLMQHQIKNSSPIINHGTARSVTTRQFGNILYHSVNVQYCWHYSSYYYLLLMFLLFQHEFFNSAISYSLISYKSEVSIMILNIASQLFKIMPKVQRTYSYGTQLAKAIKMSQLNIHGEIFHSFHGFSITTSYFC